MMDERSDASARDHLEDATTVIDTGRTIRRWEFKCRNKHSQRPISGKVRWTVEDSRGREFHSVEQVVSRLSPGEIHDSEKSLGGGHRTDKHKFVVLSADFDS